MKKRELFSTLVFAMFTMISIVAMAQVNPGVIIIDPGGGIKWDVIVGMFETIGTLSVLVVIITQYIHARGVIGFTLHWTSWAISVACAVIAKIVGLGMFIGLGWLLTVSAGVLAGAAANGIADWQVMQYIFGVIKKMKKT